MKSLSSIILAIVLIGSFSLASVTGLGSAQNSTFKIFGYILDSSGNAVSGAMIIFNVPQIVPAAYSDTSGHYEILAPAGTYHVNVWPPFDSNFIYYDQPGFVVASDSIKNITLSLGYKVSGYIFDSFGQPVPKAVISLNNFLCGWYSNYSGYYFVTAPAGTYTLSARPGNGPTNPPNFTTYNENNFVVDGNIRKNITVATLYQSTFEISGYILDTNGHGIEGANIIFNAPSIVPSVFSDSSGHYVISAPAGTYHVNVWPPFDTNYLSYDEPRFVVGSDMTKNITMYSGYKVSGYISDSSGEPVVGAAILFRNAIISPGWFGSGWFSTSTGYYFLSVPAGTYTIDAHPRTGNYYSGPTTNFPTYDEYNFTVNADTVKNITVGTSPSIPSQTSTSSALPSPDISLNSSSSPVSSTNAVSTQVIDSAHSETPSPENPIVDVNTNLSNDTPYWGWIVIVIGAGIIVTVMGIGFVAVWQMKKSIER